MIKIALKRLTQSDLTFFQWHFENKPAGKQKAINLSKSVFIDSFFPLLPSKLNNSGNDHVSVPLYLFGPGAKKAPYIIQRKISKMEKNWRLHGATIRSSAEDPERFNILEPGDIAIMGFDGVSSPYGVYLDFLSAKLVEDQNLHMVLSDYIGNIYGNMKQITSSLLLDYLNKSNINPEHPAYRFSLNHQLMHAIQGDSKARSYVYHHTGDLMPSCQYISSVISSKRTIKSGIKLIETHFAKLLTKKIIDGYDCTIIKNPTAPFTFTITVNDMKTHIKVLATIGEHDEPLHLSLDEVKAMNDGSIDYEIYRISKISKSGGQLRISKNTQSFASKILEALENATDVQVDNITTKTEALVFSTMKVLYF